MRHYKVDIEIQILFLLFSELAETRIAFVSSKFFWKTGKNEGKQPGISTKISFIQ